MNCICKCMRIKRLITDLFLKLLFGYDVGSESLLWIEK
jgi:hypothetical protein